MITGDTVTIGDLGIVRSSILMGGIQNKASPQPVQRLPTTSDTMPVSSELNMLDYSKSSWAFVALTIHTFHNPRVETNANAYGNQNIVGNWNSAGRLNA